MTKITKWAWLLNSDSNAEEEKHDHEPATKSDLFLDFSVFIISCVTDLLSRNRTKETYAYVIVQHVKLRYLDQFQTCWCNSISWAQLCTAVPLSLPFATLITVLCLQCYQLESRGHSWCVDQAVVLQCFQLREDTMADVLIRLLSCSVFSWGKTLQLMCWSGCCLAVFSAEGRHYSWCVDQAVVL